MRYAIMISLDYETNPEEECRNVWRLIRDRMVEAGFRMEGRIFTAEMPKDEACEVARDVIEDISNDAIFEGKGIYMFLKEFYGYDHTETVNLMLPPSATIELEEG